MAYSFTASRLVVEYPLANESALPMLGTLSLVSPSIGKRGPRCLKHNLDKLLIFLAASAVLKLKIRVRALPVFPYLEQLYLNG